MSLLSGLVGITKLVSNFSGGGAGSSTTKNESGSQTANQQVTGNQSQSTAGSQSANRREFSDGFLQLLELTTKDALGSGAAGQSALRDQLTEIQNNPIDFDADAFVKGITDQARSSVNSKLESDVNSTVSATGGSTSGNSAASLLANRLRGDAAANIAGVQQSAAGTAAQIESSLQAQRSASIAGVAGSVNDSLTSLLAALRGGETQQDTKSAENMVGNSSQTSTGQTLTSGNTAVNTPFNWAKGLGNLFGGIDQDA